MTSGGQCAMMAGAVLMLLWFASSWVMQLQEVGSTIVWCGKHFVKSAVLVLQVELRIATHTLVLVLALSTWMMLPVLQVLANCWSALADQS